jgi:patatin-like phospholipase/acyl hydrolase
MPDPIGIPEHITRLLAPGGQKRMLALDGGGIRGLITVEILAALERMLRERLGKDKTFRLADYFHYVAGTSTGAIIATCISLGMSVDEIRGFYQQNGKAMFDKAGLLQRFRYKYEDERLAQTLRQVFNQYLSADERGRGRTDVTLGSAALRTLLLVVMRNATTDSPWPISNNPNAKYNERTRPDCNLDIPLWQLVRASTAAPVFFPPEELTLGGKSFLFVDGGVTTYNNPSFLLFLMATLGAYRMAWRPGPDTMLLVSIGTGTNPNANAGLTANDLNLVYNATTIPSALMFAALNEQDMLCRVFGRCRAGGALDREIENLILSDEEEKKAVLPRLFTYMRYNAELSAAGLAALGLGTITPAHVQQMDSIEHMDDLRQVGVEVAKSIQPSHFDGFLG